MKTKASFEEQQKKVAQLESDLAKERQGLAELAKADFSESLATTLTLWRSIPEDGRAELFADKTIAAGLREFAVTGKPRRTSAGRRGKFTDGDLVKFITDAGSKGCLNKDIAAKFEVSGTTVVSRTKKLAAAGKIERSTETDGWILKK